jgi:hypothetical protein
MSFGSDVIFPNSDYEFFDDGFSDDGFSDEVI